jgi:hypothetical protein
MKTALTGIALGIVFCIALIFSNRAILLVHTCRMQRLHFLVPSA